MGQYSSNLFAEPSFLEGMARVLDLGNTLNEYNRCLTGEMADYYALLGDWRTVGDFLQQGMQDCSSLALKSAEPHCV